MARATAAAKAFKAAQKAIAEAAKSGSTELSLLGEKFRALDRLPAEIAGLTGLTMLDLSYTGVSDLEPLRGLTGLTGLYLSRTGVSDLEPLRGMTGLTWLDLSGTGVSDLEPLRGLTGLTELVLSGTGVRDLEPLRGLTGLTWLDLRGTGVSDLEPLRGLTGLRRLDLSGTGVFREALKAGLRGKTSLISPEARGMKSGFLGVHLNDCRAATEDARIARIAGIEDDRERTIALFEELGLEWRDVAPDPDPLVPVKIEDGKLEITPSFPSADELEERLKRSLHDRLRPKAAEAAQKAGNEFPRMAGKTRVLCGLVDRPFEELDLLAIHLEVEDIDARARAGGEDGLPYDPDLLAAVAEVTRLGPGLTRGNKDVELFHERLLKTRETAADASVEDTRGRLSDAILAMPDAHGPNSLQMERQIKATDDPDFARTLRAPKQRNMLWRLGSVAALAIAGVASNVAANLIASAYGVEITAFVTRNWALLLEVAATYGASFASWIAGTVGVLLMGKGVREEIRKRKVDGDMGDAP